MMALKKIKKGLRVVFNGEKAKVIVIGYGAYTQAKILVYSSMDRQWVAQTQLELDKEFYRDKKINKLL